MTPILPPTYGLEAAWHRLHWLIEATARQSSLVFLMCQAADQEDRLRERTAFLARRLPWRFDWVDMPTPTRWAADNLPVDGVAWLSLRDVSDDEIVRCLHLLNHVRTGLVSAEAGCIVLSGDTRLRSLALAEAADLWSVRSLALIVEEPPSRVSPPALCDANNDRVEAVGVEPQWRPGLWTPPSLTLPEEYGTPDIIQLIRQLNGVYFALPDQAASADALLDQVWRDAPHTGLSGVLLALAGIYVGGASRDVDAVSEAVGRATGQAMDLPAIRFRLVLLDAIWRAGRLFGCAMIEETKVAQAALTTARGLLEQVGTPEAARDVSVSLDNVGRIAEMRGLLDEASQSYAESLGLRRGVLEQVGTPEAARDVSVSLDNVGRIARMRGLLDEADRAEAESRELQEGLKALTALPVERQA